MKSILITNRKGGVGKSAIASQFAHYLVDKLQLRVLFIYKTPDVRTAGSTV